MEICKCLDIVSIDRSLFSATPYSTQVHAWITHPFIALTGWINWIICLSAWVVGNREGPITSLPIKLKSLKAVTISITMYITTPPGVCNLCDLHRVLLKIVLSQRLYFSFSIHKQWILCKLCTHNIIVMMSLKTLYPNGNRSRVCRT
jgi:hypothetical protein